MKKKEIKFKLAELFSGPGGLALGAIRSFAENENTIYSIEPVWANDYDADTCKTYARNIHNGNEESVVCAPVQEIDFKKVPEFDVLAFGFPCNDFSVVGEQKGFDGKFGPLYSHGVRAINTHNPKWFIAENVSGLQSANGGNAFKQILKDLESARKGYVLTPHLYKFEEYGVPQQRHRIVIIGIRKDLGLQFKVPAPTTKYNYVSARSAIENPRIPDDAQNHELTKQSAGVVERLKHIPAGENAWYEGIPQHLRLNVKGARMSQIYKRLDPQKPAYTITGSGGGGTHVYHWSEHRALTNRERARLQSFPDSFVFEGSKESARKQIGMAVPPVGAQAVISAVLKTFAGIPYESVESKLTNGEANAREIASLFDEVEVGATIAL
ncbi:MAG: Cytosine-specific methyltransferase [Candidatus Kaiserbacteria bacterium GW2011_GWA2_58_9]|uniref:Cytosine-specific methyltransferase n=1 Tax=Candidatus Kaiserbacteria bacterium GW2011_GWA2_58_9 TaxID=1618672 RepID=A0A0G1YWV3_9BACT|nr:MAG: Cytosine-specific methyltransferase [Candidatus Kaiserbacteria bacterium GW2011_GWA2_58_9]